MSNLELDQAAIAELLHGPTGPVREAVEEFADRIVAHVRRYGPEGFDQGGHRATGLLKADMHTEPTVVGENGVSVRVGTDPENPNDGYHYAEAVHQGRPGISSERPMTFVMRGQKRPRTTFHVGPASPEPFLFDAVRAVNADSDPEFALSEVETED